MKLLVLLLIFVMLVFADKGLTMWNLSVIKQSNPDYLSAEKNPAAKYFFEKFGLLGGTIIFGIITVCTLFIMFYSFKSVFGADKTLWGIFAIYGFVIFNNTYFLIKHMGII